MIKTKLVALPGLSVVRDCYEVPIVLVTGCFDVIHRGHVELLEHAATFKAIGGKLIVGLNSDTAVRTLKGEERPIHTFYDRATVMAAFKVVDYVTEIDNVKVTGAICALRPTVWVKGGDYTMATLDREEREAASEHDVFISLFPTVGNFSTSNILKKL